MSKYGRGRGCLRSTPNLRSCTLLCIVNAYYARCTSAGGKRVRTRTYRAGAGAHAQQWPCKLLLSPESGRKLCCCLSNNYSRFSSLSWSISLTLWTASHFKYGVIFPYADAFAQSLRRFKGTAVSLSLLAGPQKEDRPSDLRLGVRVTWSMARLAGVP